MARRVSSLLKTSPRFHKTGSNAGGEADPEAAAQAETKPRRRGRPPKKASPEPSEAKQASLVEVDDCFEPLDDTSEEDHQGAKQNGEPRRRRMVNQVFGLREWPRSKPIRDSGHFTDAVKSVPVRRRDTRVVGRSGSSQLILSNPDLEQLIVEVFQAIDSPADVRTVRQLVLSKIPLQDYNVASLDEEISAGNAGQTIRREATDTRETPEGVLLRVEQDEEAARLADEFLESLRRAVNNNERRYSRLLTTLWHCYYDPQGLSQLEIARLLGVSDSLVSDNRRLIEHELKKLKLSVEDGAIFSESLERLVAKTSEVYSN